LTGPAGSATSAEQSFPPEAESVRAARRFVLDVLAGAPEEALGQLAVMVSELATNAIVHADTAYTVRVARAGTEVRLEVSDAGGGQPTVASPTPNEPTGRGLRIVEAMAEKWGVRRGPSGTTTVWCTLILDPDPGPVRAPDAG
jgi:anti-sigma regulatory factor (Ser/Thr protein kinase)